MRVAAKPIAAVGKLRHAFGGVCLGLAASLLPTGAALAEKGLPKPYVSPALDAVLLPITAEVRKQFRLGKKAAGVVVVSVEPGGTGELYGLEPGEVVTKLDGKIIRRPVDIDSSIRYKLNKGDTFFFFEGSWKNRKQKTIVELSAEDYTAPVSIADIPRWHGFNRAGARARGKRGNGRLGNDGYFWVADDDFYYADFCDGYLDYFPVVYDRTVVYVDEVIVTDVYITSIESRDTIFYYDDAATGYDWPEDDYYIAEVDSYVSSDAFTKEYNASDVTYDDAAYDPETGLTSAEASDLGIDLAETAAADDAAYEDPAPDDASAADDVASDDPVAEEPAYDEPVAEDAVSDDAAADEAAYDAAADGQTYEDPVADEPVADEPVADEPAYDEPVADEAVADEPVYEEPAPEEQVYEEATPEEPVYEDPAPEEPVYEEPAPEEPVYEEPAPEEPVYEEPTSDDGGGSCTYDENGDQVCG